MKKRWWIKLLVVLFVFFTSAVVIGINVYRTGQNLAQRYQARTELNAQLASDYFEKELEEGQNVTENIESGTVGNEGNTAVFTKTAKYMLKRYDGIYSLQLIHKGQSQRVYQDKASERGKSSLLADPQVKAAFNYCRQKKINGIVGPIKTGEGRDSLAVCQPVFIKGKFWGYSVALIKKKDLFESTFKKLDKLGYYHCLSKTHIVNDSYYVLDSNMKTVGPRSAVSFRLGGCTWKLEAVRKDAGQMPREIKSSLLTGILTVVINTALAAILVNYFERGRKLTKIVDTDYLTGLMSRQAFDREVGKYLLNNTGKPVIGALIDIDDFKYINDLYGHEAGDAALKSFARVLEKNFSQLGLVGRNGGDEFAVFLEQTTLTEGRMIFNKLFKQKLTFNYQGKDYPYSISLGFAAYPDQSQSREELMYKADVALYAVKMTGKGAMAGYHPDMMKEGRAQLGFNLRDLAVNLPGAFFIYREDDERILFANNELLRIMECSSREEFIEYVGQKVKGLIAPEDYDQAVKTCKEQVGDGDEGLAKLDYHVITKESHKRIYMHAVAHMVKNDYFGKIYYVIIGPRPVQK
ncbi:GGDEF domain-containing protein [Lactobacillus sp.]|uniref:sensor domain-containing diguanylate cyclase n=1 Tax=Lactobacillus sp. TaxID=1591 RepID=UPI003F0D6998